MDNHGEQIEKEVQSAVDRINKETKSRGSRVANALRNAELNVLRGSRSGKLYRKSNCKTRYRASAPGEPPARRTGHLRQDWDKKLKVHSFGKKMILSACIKSRHEYSGYLQDGTVKMAARPFVDPIKEKAEPDIEKILKESYK